jgi:tetrahydromethanopterin S-methyltransferase subunit A
VGFTTPGEWRLPRQVKVVELLAVPKPEPVTKKIAEMVLNEGGGVRLQ